MSASAQVAAVMSSATGYANSAQTQLQKLLQGLQSNLYAPPSISVSWKSLAPPSLASLPAEPTLPDIAFNAPGGEPGAFTETLGDITIDSFDETAPVISLPSPPSLVFGDAPSIPGVGAVEIPSAPAISSVALPSMLTLTTPSFAGVDLKEDWLTRLENTPTLELVAPTPYSYTPGTSYTSSLLDALKSKISARLNGGTGLPPAVEQAIWDRARDRETAVAQSNIDEIQRQSEALGFQLPAGTTAAQMREAQQNYYDKLSELSRDVSVKQAELEQSNLKQAIEDGMKLEGQLIEQSLKIEQLTFESYKTAAENAIACYNAEVEQFKALLEGYQAYAAAYKTIIEGQMAKVEVYKSELAAEETKAQVNNTLVQQYKAQIEAGMAKVEVYKAQLGGAQALIGLEQTKISAAGEQIKAYAAKVNAETSKVEAFKAQVTAEATKVDIYRTKAQAFSAKAGAQAEKARAETQRFQSLAQAYAAQWDGYKAKVSVESERIRALAVQSSSKLDGFKAAATAIEAKANMQTRVWEGQIKQYEAGQNFLLNQAKINNDALQWGTSARLDAVKTGAQVYAQLTSSALGMVHASAGMNSNAGLNVSYSYSNDTSGLGPTMTEPYL